MAGSDQKAGRAPERANIEADEDPLIELARIVSEDGGFAGPRTEKLKVNRNEPAEPNAFTDGLEAELLQELESSFGARDVPAAAPRRPVPPREAPAPYAPRQASAPPPQRGLAQATQRPPRPASDERDPEDLLKSIEEQLGQFERRQAERLAVTTASFSSSRREPAPTDVEWPAETEPDEAQPAAPEIPAPQESRDSRQRGVVAHLRPLDDEDDAPTPEERWEELAQPDPEPAAHPEYRFRGPANAGWDRAAPESAGHDTSPVEEPPLRRAGRAEGFRNDEATDADLFAPAGKTSRAHDPFADDVDASDRGKASDSTAEAFRGRRRVSPFPEFDEPPVSIAETGLGKNETRLADALEPRYADSSYGGGGADWKEAAAAAEEPGIATQPSAGRRSAAARTQAAKHGRTRVALLTMLGVAAVVLIGGAGALYLRSTERAPTVAPPVIAADEGPVKVEAAPDPAATESETAGEAVFNRVAGAQPDTPETVVENAEEPREVARIVLPPPQAENNDEVVRPVGDQAPTTQESASAANEDIGPRLVPTYTVRPDGTIIANNDAGDQPAAPPAADQQIAAEPAAPTSAAAPTASETLSPAAEEAMTPRPTIDEPADIAVVAPEQLAAIPQEPAEPEAPVNLLAESAAPAAASPAQADAAAGFVVQVSSQRSMEQAQAAFVDLQQRFTSVLGNLTPNIQQADLGAKGIYYRVRVGPWAAREEAIQVCEALKTAGGDCLVTQ